MGKGLLDRFISRALDTRVAGPLKLRDVGQGLREAIVDPIARDERMLYEARHANPMVDLAASQHPAYGIPAAIQDIAHGGDPLFEAAGAVPFVKGLRAAHGVADQLRRYGAKGTRAAGGVLAGAYGVTGTNIHARGEEIMNPGEMPRVK